MKWTLFFLAAIFVANAQEDPDDVDPMAAFKAAIARLAQRVAVQDPPKGIPFPQIRGPHCKTSRIGIVGAGPSGLHMAYELKQRGFTDVTVVEATNRIGGKSNSVELNGVSNTLSTLLVGPDYAETVIPLFQRFGLFNMTRFNLQYHLSNDASSPAVNAIEVLVAEGFTPTQLLQEAAKYIEIHRSLFGNYEGELMRRPHPETMKRISGRFDVFLQRHNLHALMRFLDLTTAAAGYNQAHRLSTIQGLLWNTPRYLILGLLSRGVFVVRTEKGFHSLWEAMIEEQNIDIVYDFRVDDVIPKANGGFSLRSRGREMDFDFIVWSGLTRDFAALPSVRRIIIEWEDFLVLSESMPVHVGAHVVNMRNDQRAAISLSYLPALDKTFDDDVAFSFDAYASYNVIPREAYVNRDYTINGASPDVRAIAVFQYGTEARVPSQAELRKRTADFFASGFNATDIEFLATVRHEYFPHWSFENVDRGFHWKLFDMQGKYGGLWFTGGGASWDSTKSVMEYKYTIDSF